MNARSPLEAIEQLDEAFNRGDLDAILGFYEDAAIMVVEPGRLAAGKAAMREVFEMILGMGGTARQEKTHVIEAGDVALFTSKWNITGTAPDGSPISRESFSSVILRKQADGGWRIVVDNSWGPAV